jgi:hypothetical protein
VSLLRFKGVHEFGYDTLGPLTEKNIVTWYDWCSLGIGAFTNVEYGDSGCLGGRLSRLRLADTPSGTLGTVWEGYRKNWAWESGIDYGYQPIQITGVYVNSTFYPTTTTTGIYAHNINYPLGRVEFSGNVGTGSVVEAAFSHKYWSWEPSNVDWFREITFRSFTANEESTFNQVGSGLRMVFNENRIQLPAVVVEMMPNRQWKPAQLGGGQWCYAGVQFHIFAENSWDREKLVDIITMQNEKTISGINFNTMAEATGMPLTTEGYKWSGTKYYPELLGLYPWGTIRFMNLTGMEVRSATPLYRAVVRGTCELYCPGL